jgi:hypothetical protein
VRADPPPSGFYAPDPYADRWLVIGLGLLAAILLWYVAVWWLTRERRRAAGTRLSGDRLEVLRSDCLRQIGLLVADVRAGRVAERQGHQQLSLLVRHFVMDASGVAATAMTLTDLRDGAERQRLAPVGDVVEVLYPGEFGAHGAGELEAAAEAARRMVSQWN